MTDNSTRLHGPVDGGNYDDEWSDESIKIHLLSDVGKKREHNEDSCLLQIPDDPETREKFGILMAVADGMGGASAGETAFVIWTDWTGAITHLAPTDAYSRGTTCKQWASTTGAGFVVTGSNVVPQLDVLTTSSCSAANRVTCCTSAR